MIDNLVVYNCEVGERHEEIGLPCQDNIAISSEDAKNFVVVLADGAGSVENADIISKIVTRTLTEELSNNEKLFKLSDGEIQDLVLKVPKVELQEKELQADCTLILYVENEENETMLIHIGDGIALNIKNKETKVLSYPENGDLPNQTFFLSDENAKKHIRIYRNNILSESTIVLSSDGAERLIYDFGKQDCAPAITIMNDWFKETKDTELISEQLSETITNVLKGYTTDDISIALIKRGE